MDWKAGTPDSVEGHHGCDANADADDFNVGDYDIDGYDPDSFCETGELYFPPFVAILPLTFARNLL